MEEKIEVIFENEELNENELSEEFWYTLSKKYEYTYNNDTKIKNLLLFLNENICPNYAHNLESIQEHYRFCVNNEYIEPNLEYNLGKFLLNFNLDMGPIKMYYVIGVGGGNGAFIEELAHIRINTREPEHRNHPHVHIYKNDHNKSVSIDLIKMKEHEQNEYKLTDFFNKNQIEEIYEILELHKQELINFYEMVQKGMQPKEFIIEHNNKEFLFK